VKLSVVQALAAPPERVFAALMDPAVLQACIEGCESLTKVGEGVYESRVRIGIAGLKGSYAGRVEIRDPRPPGSFTLVMEGKGPGGFVRGTSAVTLAPKDGGTELRSEGDLSVGGVLAAVASRLVESAAKSHTVSFFARLSERLARPSCG
jgi:hypothetical protein